MKNKLTIQILLVLTVVLSAGYFAFVQKTSLGLDLKGGVYVVLQAKAEEGKTINPQDMKNFVEVLDRRINGLGVSEPRVSISGADRVIIELPGIKDTEEAVKLIGKTALLEFQLVEKDGKLTKTGLDGKDLKKADVASGQLGEVQISFELTPDGAKKFAEITRNNIGRQLAITLDGETQTAPTIQSEIPGGKGVITGNYTTEEAKKMATLLNAGALPLRAEILETRAVGATLGEESIAQSYKAGIAAMVLILIFLVSLYRLPGLIAGVALGIFGILAFGTLNYFGAVLSLPGIAGFILSLGVAVDANVIIFERIKEELRNGQSLSKAIDAGFSKAFSAIFDGNITSIIISGVLFSFGTGPIKGFAVTLIIGVLASMFTAITVTKLLLKLFVTNFRITSPKLFGIKGVN